LLAVAEPSGEEVGAEMREHQIADDGEDKHRDDVADEPLLQRPRYSGVRLEVSIMEIDISSLTPPIREAVRKAPLSPSWPAQTKVKTARFVVQLRSIFVPLKRPHPPRVDGEEGCAASKNNSKATRPHPACRMGSKNAPWNKNGTSDPALLPPVLRGPLPSCPVRQAGEGTVCGRYFFAACGLLLGINSPMTDFTAEAGIA
jgi:hypothetical protein